VSETQDPRTGATPEQIEVARERGLMDFTTDCDDYDNPDGVYYSIHYSAALLIPPGYVIARQQDVITPEMRQAIMALCDEAEACVLAWDADAWRKSIYELTEKVRDIAEGGDR
jgi:hypothetical protein